jgi:ribosome maturation factor RimP
MNPSAEKTKFSASQVDSITSKVFGIVEQVLPEQYYLLAVDLEKDTGLWFLRVYVAMAERGSRMNLGDCEAISRRIDPLIEALPELRDASYSLEVSSPGSFRPLKTQREMDFYQGEPVRVVEHAPHDPKAKHPKVLSEIQGLLAVYDEAASTITLTVPDQPEPVVINLGPSHAVYLNPHVTSLTED